MIRLYHISTRKSIVCNTYNRHYEKVGNKEPICIEDELPFEIPDSWCWVRFPQIVAFELGKTPDRHTDKFWNNGVYSWFSIADMKDKQTVTFTKEKISATALQEKFGGVLVPQGTLIMSFKLTVGRTSILGTDAVHNEAIISIFPYVSRGNITRNYLLNVLGLLVEYVDQTDAIKGATLNSNKLKNMLVPLPPFAEQSRIVSEIEMYEPLIAEYDKLEQQKSKLDSEIYDKLKKSILQYAIQGKLVPQYENDEPASELLKRIRAEKKEKLGKKYVDSYIYKGDDNCYYEHIGGKAKDEVIEVPFDLPNNWSWCRLDNLALYKKGPFGSSLTKDMFVPKSDTSIKVYEQKNAIYKDCTLGSYYISEQKYNTMKSFEVFSNDIIVSCAGTIGETYVLPHNCPKGIINQALMKITLFKQEIVKFYLLYFDYILKIQAQKSSKGSAIKNIPPFEILKNMLMPIPPLDEQKRILNKINEIFAKL